MSVKKQIKNGKYLKPRRKLIILSWRYPARRPLKDQKFLHFVGNVGDNLKRVRRGFRNNSMLDRALKQRTLTYFVRGSITS